MAQVFLRARFPCYYPDNSVQTLNENAQSTDLDQVWSFVGLVVWTCWRWVVLKCDCNLHSWLVTVNLAQRFVSRRCRSSVQSRGRRRRWLVNCVTPAHTPVCHSLAITSTGSADILAYFWLSYPIVIGGSGLTNIQRLSLGLFSEYVTARW